MEAAVYGAAVVVLAAEVVAAGGFLVACHVHGVLHELVDALVAGGGDAHYRDAEDALHLVDADGASVPSHLVHHVEGQHHRHSQLHQLQGEVEITFNVACVHYVDEAAGFRIQDEFAGDDLLCGVRRQGIDAREVSDGRVRMALDHAVLAIHGDAGEVADVLVGPREHIEEGSLAAVLLAGESENQFRTLGERVFVVLGVVFAALAEARVGVVVVQPGVASVLVGLFRGGCLRGAFADFPDFDPGCISLAQGKGITAYQQLDRIAQRGF